MKFLSCFLTLAARAAEPSYFGIYPQLAYANYDGECGTGAVATQGRDARGDHLRAAQWKGTMAKKDMPSDASLMTGYDRKSLELSADAETKITIEIDISGHGDWKEYQDFDVSPKSPAKHEFSAAFQDY